MIRFLVLFVPSGAVMDDRGGARLTREESLQTVVDVVPSILGLGGDSHHQDESQHRSQANAQQTASFKAHCNNSSSVFGPTLSKTIIVGPHKAKFCRTRAFFYRLSTLFSRTAMATGGDPGVALVGLRLASIVGRPRPYCFFRSHAAT